VLFSSQGSVPCGGPPLAWSKTPSHRIKDPARAKATFAVDLRFLIRWDAGNKTKLQRYSSLPLFQISPLMTDQYWDVAFSAAMVWSWSSHFSLAENINNRRGGTKKAVQFSLTTIPFCILFGIGMVVDFYLFESML
jgi:hypothetical protein